MGITSLADGLRLRAAARSRTRSESPGGRGQECGKVRDLTEEIYADLKRLAGSSLSAERRRMTLQATALAHEAWLRLGAGRARWDSRAHFFGAASRAIRRILIDHARDGHRLKRGGGQRGLPLEEAAEVAVPGPDFDVLALDEALQRLAVLDGRKARIVELRFFGGLSVDETAAALGSSASVVAREWRFARAWLRRELDGGRP